MTELVLVVVYETPDKFNKIMINEESLPEFRKKAEKQKWEYVVIKTNG